MDRYTNVTPFLILPIEIEEDDTPMFVYGAS